MMSSFLKKCRPLRIREAQLARRRKLQSAKPRVRLWLERLESRTVPTTITRTSDSIFHNDLAPHGGAIALTSSYVSYQITNTDGVNYADVWATIGNFTAASGQPVVTLAPNAASAIDLGPLANGQTKTAFFYLGSSADTTVTQTHTVSVFNGPPTSGALLTSRNFSFTSVQGTIESNANKATSVVISPSVPTVGGTFTVTVTGQTGTIGSADVLDFTPAAYTSWRADAFQLVGTTITFSGGSTGTFTDTLGIPTGAITGSANYTAVYTFQTLGTTATLTTVSPVAYISSGAGVDHTTTGNFNTLPPVPVPQPANPTIVTAPAPSTVTLPTASVTLKDTAVLANGFRPTGTITFKLVGPGGDTVDTETVTVNGNGSYTTPNGFTLPGGGTVAGSYQWNATYSGDTNNNAANDVNSANEQVTVNPASTTLATAAGPAVTLPIGPPAAVTLTDSADLEGGYFPGGSIGFTLTGPGGTMLDTVTDMVSGNGTYTASTTLPTTGLVAGTYTWAAHYFGDANNTPASDQGGVAEQTVVSPASPTLTTSPRPTTVTLGTSPVTLTDAATLASAYFPVGTIAFMLVAPGGATVDTETVTVNGNGTYTTSNGFALPSGAATGTYQWNATYSGDLNNNLTNDVNEVNEQVTVTRASPTLLTTASPAATLPTGPPGAVTLSDSADLEGGYFPGGSIVFTLTGPGGTTVATVTDTVNGNGTYTARTILPTTGLVAGTYSWSVSYGGDRSNNSVTETGTALNGEQTIVSPASPKLTTTPSPSTLAAGVTLKDTAVLSGGYHPTGTITFTLVAPDGSTADTETVPVNGNGIYVTLTGFTPSMLTGTYQWNASYNGDPNNNTASDINVPAEQVTASAPALTLTTSPSPATVTLGINTVTLNDTASLAGGFTPTGTIAFTLFHNGAAVHTETVTVNGDGVYTTTGFTLPSTGTQTGIFQWDATYNGDANNPVVSDVNNANEQVTVSPASPGLVTIASPSSATLGTNPVTLNDQALLAGGYHPTGMITFTLVGPGGATVDTEMVTVNGNGTYATPAGFTVPSSSMAAGTYQWHATYNGDPNNTTTSEANPVTEPVTVSAASPTLTTTPNPSAVTLAKSSVTLTDSATLANGFQPTGTITFTLVSPSGATVDTETVPVNGNGTYTTETGFILPSSGTVAGTYQWNATYSGDNNNNSETDIGVSNEQVTVTAATPTFSTTPNPTTVTLGAATPPVLTDSATLSGGFSPTGRIFFVLFKVGSNTPLDIETVTINGNGTYTTPRGFPLPTTGVVIGTYQWDASYSGDFNNFPVVDNDAANEQVTVTAATPTFSTTPNPTTVTLGAATPPVLTDSATLSGGFNPTWRIFFVLFKVGSNTPLDIETVTINGNGTYMTPRGFTLPTTGTATGTYQWDASYSGDPNNSPVVENDAVNEQVAVNPASPTLVTEAGPNVTLPSGPPGTVTVNDTALLSGGFNPTGTITFTLFVNGGATPVDTETVTVTGNGAYSASTTLPTTGPVVGTYTWTASYNGDANNATANDQGGIAEQTVVSPASPTLMTTASPVVSLPAGPPGMVTLTDAALLSGGYFPTGSVVFTLTGPNGFSFTQTDAVSGNGTYMASTTLPTTGPVAGTYTWAAAYKGDPNNAAASDQGGSAEQTVVSPASTSLVTTASTTDIRQGTAAPTLMDTATLSGGFFPTGSIVFTVTGPGGFKFTQTDPVNGNGTYAASAPLPAMGTVAGMYVWTAHYAGDANNNAANDQGGADEQATVPKASPTLVTTDNPPITLGTTAPTLSDSAVLSGGFNPKGDIFFTLTGPGGFSFTQTDAVSDNGTYTASVTLPTAGTVAGTYTWRAHYSGDPNDAGADDEGGPAEQTVVSAASPTITTKPNPTSITLGTSSMTLIDSAVLAGSFQPTGTITFKLLFNGGITPVDTETVTVNGNGTYTTPAGFTLPTTLTVAGTYQWVASYSGDSNNIAASDINSATEQVTVSPGNPTISTSAGPSVVVDAGVPLGDSATLAGGFAPTGTITFTLTNPSGAVVYTNVVMVNGNGVYDTSHGNNPGGLLPSTPGTYQWMASYSGDSNNGPVDSALGDEPQLAISGKPRIQIVTLTNGTNNNSGTGPLLVVGSTVTWTYLVSNPGNDPLTHVVVTDNHPGVVPVYQSGDANHNGLLDRESTGSTRPPARPSPASTSTSAPPAA